MKKKTNKQAVADYHKKIVNLATVRIPSVEECGVDYRRIIKDELKRRDVEGDFYPSLNSYILSLIEMDMHICIPNGVKVVNKTR